MEIEFIKNGGFNESGGFIEYEGEKTGDEPVYQRDGFLTVDMKCRDIQVVDNIIPSYRGKAEIQRGISAVADFEPALWGSWRLALLGSKRTHQSVTVNIRESADDKEAFHAGGRSASDRDDIDFNHDESFYVDAVIAPAEFRRLLDALSEGGCDLQMRVSFGLFPNFLTTWSPSMSEGRTVKFLEREYEILNGEDFRKDFFIKKADKDAPGFEFEDERAISITVVRPYQTIHQAPQVDVDPDIDGFNPRQAPPNSDHALSKEISNLSVVIAKSAAQIRNFLVAATVVVLLVWLVS